MIATTTEPACITKRRTELEAEIANLSELVEPAIVAGEVFGGDQIEIGRIECAVRVSLFLDDYRDVVPYLRELANRGYHASKHHDTFYEDEAKTCRCYTRGKIKVWVSLTGAKCQRVQVGTKEVPVYEIKCG